MLMVIFPILETRIVIIVSLFIQQHNFKFGKQFLLLLFYYFTINCNKNFIFKKYDHQINFLYYCYLIIIFFSPSKQLYLICTNLYDYGKIYLTQICWMSRGKVMNTLLMSLQTGLLVFQMYNTIYREYKPKVRKL